MSKPTDPPKGPQPHPHPEDFDPSKAWLSASSSSPSTDPSSPQPQDANSNSNLKPDPPQQKLSLSAAVETIKPADLLTVHTMPCGRDGLMTGIAGGVGMMGLRWMTGSPVMKAANWGVGTFVGASMLGWEYCRWQRRKEFEKMKRVVEVYDQRQAEIVREKKKRQEEEAQKRRLEEAEAAKRKWSWKFW